jgi:hypothetical protein
LAKTQKPGFLIKILVENAKLSQKPGFLTSRNLDPGLPQPYKMFAETPYLTQVYLDEIAAIPQSSLGLGIVQ